MPLSGTRVVDLTRILAGPFGSMILADMGAEVVKIETPGAGDPVRHQGVIREVGSRAMWLVCALHHWPSPSNMVRPSGK